MVRIALAAFLILLIGLAQEELVDAQDVARLQSGVVKITAKPPGGTTNVGTGFIVRVDKDAAYIVTAAHVVAGDTHPKVEFFTKQNMPVTAEVLGLEGNDEVSGLALVVVRGTENLPNGITALSLATTSPLSGGEDILMIGFPRNAGPWAIIKGNISSRFGRNIHFYPPVESGHSGGPVFHGGNVVAVVGAGGQSVGLGVAAKSVQHYIEGFGITAQESKSSGSMATESSPPPAATDKLEPRHMTQDREITGKDGAPMVLIPAGEFTMGSREEDESADKNERPAHSVYLDAFYIDKYEVTTSRYAIFFHQTNRAAPLYWSDQVLQRHEHKPVAGVDWNDATAYCAWAGKRLPIEAEWEKAARGTDQRLYPWGNEAPSKQRANFGQRFDFDFYRVATDVGSFEQGKSPYGAHDMAGNVLEWVVDWYDENYYGKSPERNPKGPSSGETRVLRSGSWGFDQGGVRSAGRMGGTPADRSVLIGFRCAQDAPK